MPSQQAFAGPLQSSAAQALHAMLQKEGPQVLAFPPTRLKNYLADYLVDCPMLVRHSLATSVDLGIPKEVVGLGPTVRVFDYRRLVARLVDDAGLAKETANAVVQVWIGALGWRVPEVIDEKPPPEPRRPDPPVVTRTVYVQVPAPTPIPPPPAPPWRPIPSPPPPVARSIPRQPVSPPSPGRGARRPFLTLLVLALLGAGIWVAVNFGHEKAPVGSPPAATTADVRRPTDTPQHVTCPRGYDRCGDVSCDINLMADSNQCGRCGHGCKGGTCQGGHCQPRALATSLRAPAGIQIYAKNQDPQLMQFFWQADDGNGANPIATVGVNGDDVRALGTPQDLAAGFAIVKDALYSSERGNGRVFSTDVSAGDIVTAIANGESDPMLVRADEKAVYWVADGATTIRKASLVDDNEGGPVSLLTGQSPITRMALDKDAIYWLTREAPGGGAVYRIMKDGGVRFPVATEQPSPVGMDAHGSSVYWTNFGSPGASDGSIMSCSKETSEVEPILTNLPNPRGITVDRTHLYWTIDRSDGSIWRAALDGTNAVQIAHGQNHPYMIVLAGDLLCWENRGSGAADGSLVLLVPDEPDVP